MKSSNLTDEYLSKLTRQLIDASEKGNITKIKSLIAAKADVNLGDETYCERPLHLASSKGRIEAIKTLIAAKADVNKGDVYCQTPLYNASSLGHIKAIKLLIEAKADIEGLEDTPLSAACHYNRTKSVKLLITAKADVDKADVEEQTPLYHASRNSNVSMVKLLIAAKANVNKGRYDGETPLMLASYYGCTEAIKALIAAKADVDKASTYYDQTPMLIAIHKLYRQPVKLLKTVKLLIAAKADVNKATHADCNSETPLCAASKEEHTEVIKALIESKADVDKADKYGRTPLIIASQFGCIETIKLLIAHGANLNKTPTSKEFKDLTVLQIAVSKYYHKDLTKQKQVIQTLFECGADISVLNDKFFAKYPNQLNLYGSFAEYDSGQKIPVSIEIKDFVASLNNQQTIAKRDQRLIELNEERDANIARIKQQLIDQSKLDSEKQSAIQPSTSQHLSLQQFQDIQLLANQASDILTLASRSDDLLSLVDQSIIIQQLPDDVVAIRSNVHQLKLQHEIFKQHQNQNELLQQAIMQQLQSSISTDQINPKFTLSKDDLTEIKYLQQDRELYQYYQKMQKCFNEAFLFANIVNQGGSSIEETSKIVKYLESFKELIGDIPFASLIIGQIISVGSEVSKAKTKGKQANLSDIIFTADPIASSLLAEKIARRFAITRELNSHIQNQIIANKDQILPQNQSRIVKIKEYLRKFFKKIDEDIERGFLGQELNNSQQLAVLDFEKSAQFIFNQGISEDIKLLADEDPQKSNKIAEEIITKSLELELKYYQDQSQGQSQSQAPNPIISNTLLSTNQANQPLYQLPSLDTDIDNLMRQQFEQFKKQQEQENERREIENQEREQKNQIKLVQLEEQQKQNERKIAELTYQQKQNEIKIKQLQEENERKIAELKQQQEEDRKNLNKNRENIIKIFKQINETQNYQQKLKKLAEIADFAPNLDITIGEGNKAKNMKLGDIMKSYGNKTQSQIQNLEQNIGNLISQIFAKLENNGADQIVRNQPKLIIRPLKSRCFPRLSSCVVM